MPRVLPPFFCMLSFSCALRPHTRWSKRAVTLAIARVYLSLSAKTETGTDLPPIYLPPVDAHELPECGCAAQREVGQEV